MCAAGARIHQPLRDAGKYRRDDDTNSSRNKRTSEHHIRLPPKVWMSNIIPLNLEENPASGRGRYSSVSVLEPVMRIERTGDIESETNPPSGGSEASYRIVVNFIFEVAISGFDQSFQKHNRFFDSVSLRYLFRHGEEVDLRPMSDSAQQGIQVTNTRDKMNSIDAGMSAGMVTMVAPMLSVQAQRDFKLTYQRSMNSWRLGLSFESYPVLMPERSRPPLSSILAAHLMSKRQSRSRRDQAGSSKAPRQDQQQQQQRHFFQVLSPHKRGCNCRPRPRSCCPLEHEHQRHRHRHQFPPHRRRHSYHDRAAHWFWQTEASLRLWTPEIYSSFRCPITVMREVPVAAVDGVRHIEDVQPLLHFDFEVDTRLRVLGCGLNFFKKATKPAELRAQTDTGQQLPHDHVRFCVSCCAENISWPQHPTRNLQAEAEEEALGPGPNPRRLQTNAEFSASLRHREKMQTRLGDDPSMEGSSSTPPLTRLDQSSDAPYLQQPFSPFGSRQSFLSPRPFFLRGPVLGPDRIPPPSLADVEVSPTFSQRCFIPGHGLMRRYDDSAGGIRFQNSSGRRASRDVPAQSPPRLIVEDWWWSPAGRTREGTAVPSTDDAHQHSNTGRRRVRFQSF